MAELTDRAAEVIERGWNQGWFAVDKDGNKVSARSKDACKWCVLGAVEKAADELGLKNGDWMKIVGRVQWAAGIDEYGSLCRWNDDPNRTQEEVAAMLRSVT